MQSWLNKLYETFIETGYYNLIFDGLKNTAIMTIGALIIGCVIGIVIAIVKNYGEEVKILKPLSRLCDLYITVVRGIPVVVLLLIFFFVFLKTAEGVIVGIITFGINSGAYMAELIRSGLNAVDNGQTEAGRSLGMSNIQTLNNIVFPQAIKYILPAVGNELIALLKETSVAGYVAVVDLTRAGNLVRNNTYDSVNSLFLVAIMYLLIVICLTAILRALEKKLSKSDRH